MEMTAKELARLIELNKKKAELEFRKSVMGSDTDSEMRSVAANAAEIASKARAAGAEIFFPSQERLEALAKELETFSPESIREGLKIRDGKAYSVLHERGMIVKKNYENRSEIAKLSIMVSRLPPGEKAPVSEAIMKGAVPGEIAVPSIGEGGAARLARFLRRCGIGCSARGTFIVEETGQQEKEAKVEVQNRLIWIGEEQRPKLEENLKKIYDINSRIQLKNAVRQIKVFSEEEEKDFADLQREYLALLKQQDELLREFNEEEKLSVGS
jgi:hypothetical protein